MAKAVFVHKSTSSYDDDPYSRYHFPKSYLSTVEASVGDFVVYYEPGRREVGDTNRTGRKAYFATARVTGITGDPLRADHYYASIDDYLDFERAVPFREAGGTYERRLQKADGTTNKGMFGINVRLLPDDEYAAICQAGLRESMLDDESASTGGVSPGLMEAPVPYRGLMAVDRRLIERIVTRPFRDAAFGRAVQRAYGSTCALSGLQVVNGGGRVEVEAAHIRPVASQGPDTVRNGLALSRTVHWMFDRGLLSISDDFTILTARNGLTAPVLRLLNPDRRMILPPDAALGPSPGFLAWHRANVFKG